MKQFPSVGVKELSKFLNGRILSRRLVVGGHCEIRNEPGISAIVTLHRATQYHFFKLMSKLKSEFLVDIRHHGEPSREVLLDLLFFAFRQLDFVHLKAAVISVPRAPATFLATVPATRTIAGRPTIRGLVASFIRRPVLLIHLVHSRLALSFRPFERFQRRSFACCHVANCVVDIVDVIYVTEVSILL